jgi:hypothetical protein
MVSRLAALLVLLTGLASPMQVQSQGMDEPIEPYDPGTEADPVDTLPAGSIWDHNGSTMILVAEGSNRVFVYAQPRAALLDEGVASGTVLFTGRRDGRSYNGVAYRFSAGCGPIGYDVSGTVSADQLRVDLYGDAPRRDGSCRIASTRPDHLVFTYLSAGQ